MAKRRSRYGRAILGDEEFERQKQIQKETSGIYGPAIVERDRIEKGQEPEREPEPRKPKPSRHRPQERRAPDPQSQRSRVADVLGGEGDKSDADLNLTDLEKLLRKNPSRLETQIKAEFLRNDGPRKGALRLFIALEREREGGARPDLIAALERALDRR